MSHTYKISSVIFSASISSCPPPYLSSLFPNFDGSQPCSINNTEEGIVCFVTFETEQTPTNLSPLIKVEHIENIS